MAARNAARRVLAGLVIAVLLTACNASPSPTPTPAAPPRLAKEDHSILLVSASDKLHNARSIVRDLRVVGDDLWERFSAPRDQTLWYYRSLMTGYRGNPAHAPVLIDELDRTVTEMETLAEGEPS